MSIYGPTSTEYQQAEGEQGYHSMFAKKPDVLLKAGGLMHGNIDMTGHQVVNLGDPVYGQDAATMRYVDNYATYLNNNKVNWTGGTMTGLLNMGSFKITNVGDPENDTDVVNKKYVDTFLEHHEHDLDVIGRYLVISKNGDESYVSLRTKKNIDLQQDLLLNITSEGLINTRDYSINYPKGVLINLPNDNKLGTINFYRQLNILTQVQLVDGTINVIEISQPWTFLFSAKPNLSSGIGRSFIGFGNNSSLFLEWSSGTFNYEMPNQIDRISIDIDTTQFNHIAFEYVGNKLTVWVNGKSRKSHNINLGNLSSISMNIDQLGVLSLYDRELSKTEVAEHFVEYQVKNFSNDEVLI